MESMVLEVVGGGILAILVLKEVKGIIMYAVSRKNGKTPNGGTREVFIKQELRDVLNEMFSTLRGMQRAIEDSSKTHEEGMKDICDTLVGLTGEMNQLKGRVSK